MGTRVQAVLAAVVAAVVAAVGLAAGAQAARADPGPVDLSVDALADIAGVATNTFEHIPVLVSHDIDSPEGLRNLVEHFLPIEEAFGCRSANYIVPCAWPVDSGLVAEIRRIREHSLLSA